MPAYLTLGEVDLKYGYFYGLMNVAPEHIPVRDGWIISPSPSPVRHRYCAVVGSRKRVVQRFSCPVNPSHGQEDEVFDYEIDVAYAPEPFPPFMNDSMGETVIVNEWLADRLRGSSLKGFRLIATRLANEPVWYKPSKPPLSMLFQLTFDGIAPRQLQHIEPPSADRCPFCRKGPIVCPGCGFRRNPCRYCCERWGAAESKHEGDDDPRIVIEELGTVVPVIDPRRWDGSDFTGSYNGGWITRRALDWFLSINAGPFIVEPIAVNVLNLTEAEREHLELAKGPLSGVIPPPLADFIYRMDVDESR
jgi:hypothetical protein